MKGYATTMPLPAILFDFGGVLLRMEDPTPRTNLAIKYGLSRPALEAVVFLSESSVEASMGKIDTDSHWKAVAKVLDAPWSAIPEIKREFFSGDKLNFELFEFIRQSKSTCKIALLSNAWDDLRQRLDEDFHLTDLFDQVFISSEIGIMKPDPQIYCLACNRLGVDLVEAAFVDDTQENIEAASMLGMTGIRFHNTDQVIADLRTWLEKG